MPAPPRAAQVSDVMAPATDALWVFGYGSLMWQPGFAFEERAKALLHGYHRALCVYSVIHRGTSERPGLVLGLDDGGSCEGIAFRVAPHNARRTLDYLRAREQGTAVYIENTHQVALLDGSERRVDALCFVADRGHPQYAGQLSAEDQARLVAHASGQSGENVEYVQRTLEHLVELGIEDRGLGAVLARLPDR